MTMIDLEKLDNDTKAILQEHGFDQIPFAELLERLKKEGLNPERNRLRARVQPLSSDLIFSLPESGVKDAERILALGNEAIQSGQVGVIILNGGMATRFGGTPKGAATAIAGRSFLDLKLSQIAVAGNSRVRVLLMNSFATQSATLKHLDQLNMDLDIGCFCQMASLRVTREGDLFLDSHGKPSLYAPGHGDLPYALQRSGEVQRFIAQGGRYLTVSNVDNLGASLDPLVIGMHIDKGNPMTVEIVPTYAGDVGGFPAFVDGRVTIVEAFRIPQNYDKATISNFSTNNFVFDAKAFTFPVDLDWFIVEKLVENRPAVQFERLVNQLADFISLTVLQVPRDGSRSRFIPIKQPEDLSTQSDLLNAVLRAQGVL